MIYIYGILSGKLIPFHYQSTAPPKCRENSQTMIHHVSTELDSRTLLFNSLPTSISCVSDLNALAEFALCGGLEIPLCFVRCVVMSDLVDCAANHILPSRPPILMRCLMTQRPKKQAGEQREAERFRENETEKLLDTKK